MEVGYQNAYNRVEFWKWTGSPAFATFRPNSRKKPSLHGHIDENDLNQMKNVLNHREIEHYLCAMRKRVIQNGVQIRWKYFFFRFVALTDVCELHLPMPAHLNKISHTLANF